MNFDRDSDIKTRLGIGRYTEENLIRIISEALRKSHSFSEYVLSNMPVLISSHVAEWIHPKTGGYFNLIKPEKLSMESHNKFPGYFITYDDGGFSYGNLSLSAFFKDFNIEL